jgi:hypothetical protein
MQVLVLDTGMQLDLPWFLHTLMVPPAWPGLHQALQPTAVATSKVANRMNFMTIFCCQLK